MNRYHQFQLFITFISLFTFLIIFTYDQRVQRSKKETRGLQYNSIVAYSFEKQVELESKQQQCNPEIQFRNPAAYGVNFETSTDAVWQQVDGADVFLYSAFQDTRLNNYPYIRLIAMVKGNRPPALYCQIWSDKNANDQPFIIEATSSLIWSEKWNHNDSFEYLNPILISCLTPIDTLPKLVSIVTHPCVNSTNFKSIIQSSTIDPKHNFTICVKNMYFPNDISKQLMEWIEIHRSMGVNSIYLYKEVIHANVQKIIDTYEKRIKNVTGLNQIMIVSKQAPPEIKTRAEYRLLRDSSVVTTLWQKRRDHLIAYNDCFYRNIHTSRFVVPVDLDEIIVPRLVDNWTDLFDELFSTVPDLEQGYSSFMVQNTYFFNEDGKRSRSSKATNEKKERILRPQTLKKISKHIRSQNKYKLPSILVKKQPRDNKINVYMCNKYTETYRKKLSWQPYFFKNIFRSNFSPPGESGKSFILTKNTLSIFNHYALQSLRPGISNTFFVPLKYAQLNHYKSTCRNDILPECVKYNEVRLHDTILLKYLNPVRENLCKIYN